MLEENQQYGREASKLKKIKEGKKKKKNKGNSTYSPRLFFLILN